MRRKVQARSKEHREGRSNEEERLCGTRRRERKRQERLGGRSNEEGAMRRKERQGGVRSTEEAKYEIIKSR